jgi:hypothetical protein
MTFEDHFPEAGYFLRSAGPTTQVSGPFEQLLQHASRVPDDTTTHRIVPANFPGVKIDLYDRLG